jgi:hypothetical protein
VKSEEEIKAVRLLPPELNEMKKPVDEPASIEKI